ncbi:MAG: alpha-hydroxy acid oxidase [Anderseniella sp.]
MFDNTIHGYADARRIAQKKLPWMVFDYIDGAAGEGTGELIGLDALRAIRLLPRSLVNVEKRNTSVEIFNRRSERPFGISPMGMCNLAGPGTDKAFAHLAASHNMPVGVSTAASTSLEQMAEWSNGNAWFQLYFSGNEEASFKLLDRAKAAGYETLVLTVDVPEVGRRPRELRRGFKMPFRIGPSQFIDFALHPRWSIATLINGKPELANFGGKFGDFDRTSSRAGADWALLDRIRSKWNGNLVVKGVLNADDAVRMKKAGVDAIQVSSHGSRQLEAAPPPILALQKIRHAVGNSYPLFFDSGIRSGEDIVKAHAMGADFVLLGRAFSFAYAAGGRRGLEQMSDALVAEVSITLAQLGLRSMAEIDAKAIWQK